MPRGDRREPLQPRSDQGLMNAFNTHYGSIPREGNPAIINERLNSFINERNVNGDMSHNRVNRIFSTHDTQQGNRVNQPGGRTSHLVIEQDKTGSPSSFYQRYVSPGGAGYEQYDGGEEIPFQLTGGGQDYWQTDKYKNMLTAMNENSNFVQRPEFDMNQPSTWRNGGSVQSGPRTRQKLQPRPGYKRGPYTPAQMPEYGTDPRYKPAPMPEYGADPRYPPAQMPEYGTDPIYTPAQMPEYGFMRSNFQPDQSGIMLALANSPTVNRIQSIYNQVDPFLPEVDWNDQRLGYEYNRDLWGGNLNIGGNYDLDDDQYNLGINWGIGL